jgi:hypothetical protein
MKQIIAKNRNEAKKFASGGGVGSQRVAYWKQGGKAFRFERLPGEKEATWSEAGGAWWSATTTVNQKLGITEPNDPAPRATIEKLKCKRCGWEWVPRTEKPRQCPGCKSVKWDEDREDEKK